MAYAADVTVIEVGSGEWEVTIEETDAGSADFTEITGLPVAGDAIEIMAQKISGAGATINPILARTSPPGSATIPDTVAVPLSAAAATASVRGSAPYTVIDTSGGLGVLYHASRVNAGSNNVITTVWRIRSTW